MGLSFREECIGFFQEHIQARIPAYSSSGRVPILVDGGLTVPAETHAGFPHPLESPSMNLGREPAPYPVNQQTEQEISRILSLWEEALEAHASAGSYLFLLSVPGMGHGLIACTCRWRPGSEPRAWIWAHTLDAPPTWIGCMPWRPFRNGGRAP